MFWFPNTHSVILFFPFLVIFLMHSRVGLHCFRLSWHWYLDTVSNFYLLSSPFIKSCQSNLTEIIFEIHYVRPSWNNLWLFLLLNNSHLHFPVTRVWHGAVHHLVMQLDSSECEAKEHIRKRLCFKYNHCDYMRNWFPYSTLFGKRFVGGLGIWDWKKYCIKDATEPA